MVQQILFSCHEFFFLLINFNLFANFALITVATCTFDVDHDVETVFSPLLIAACKTIKFLNFRMPENFAVIHLKFKQKG